MIGETVGSYRIIKQLGEGGMGAVYLGEHLAIGRRAAIKVLLSTVSANPEMVQRFFNEARVKARVDHPGLVDVFDFGQLPSGAAYLVMEFLAGESLSAKIERDKRLSLPEILTIARQTAAAVGAAHGQGVIHRDLKPDNLFLTRDDELAFGIRVKVLDFGIAKLGDDPHANVHTRTNAIFGTPAYMAPEQCKGAALVDPRSDIYALGCILFEMATGRPPFVGEFVELLSAHLRDAPPRPSQLVPDLAPALERLILRALEKEPAARQQSMAELIAELDAIGRPSAQLPNVSPSGRYPAVLPGDARTFVPSSGGFAAVHPTPTPTPTPQIAPAPQVTPTPQFTPAPTPAPAPPQQPAAPTPSFTTAQLPSGERRPHTEVLAPGGGGGRAGLVIGGVVVVATVGVLFAWQPWKERAASPSAPSSPAAAAATTAPAGATAPSSPVAPIKAPPPVAEAAPLGMVAIAGGRFSIGRDDYGKPNRYDVPTHPVEVRPFAIETTEVTNAAYREFVDGGFAKAPWPKKVKDPDQFAKQPVVLVSYADALRYCQWRYPGKGRLPTEVEWERAARGSSRRRFPWGDEERKECVVGLAPGATLQAAGSVACGATPEGVLDLIGSVWEWTSSPASLYPGSELVAPPADKFHVIRGGSYFNQDWDDLTTTVRQFANQANPYLGFRCAADL